jgi:hypothetical protein
LTETTFTTAETHPRGTAARRLHRAAGFNEAVQRVKRLSRNLVAIQEGLGGFYGTTPPLHLPAPRLAIPKLGQKRKAYGGELHSLRRDKRVGCLKRKAGVKDMDETEQPPNKRRRLERNAVLPRHEAALRLMVGGFLRLVGIRRR